MSSFWLPQTLRRSSGPDDDYHSRTLGISQGHECEKFTVVPRGLGRYEIPMTHGTTTLGFKYKDGVLLAVDSRASSGQFVASQTVRKIIEISPRLLGTMAGGAADCSFWHRYLSKECRLFELKEHAHMSVMAASKVFSNIMYQYRGMGLSVGSMVAGYDGLFYVDNDGMRLVGDIFSIGSGSTYAYGVVDTEWKIDMSEADAIQLGRRAVLHATHRDAFSGGSVMVYVIRASGWERIGRWDVEGLAWEFVSKNVARFEM